MALAMKFLGKKVLKTSEHWAQGLPRQMSRAGRLGEARREPFHSSIWKETISDCVFSFQAND